MLVKKISERTNRCAGEILNFSTQRFSQKLRQTVLKISCTDLSGNSEHFLKRTAVVMVWLWW